MHLVMTGWLNDNCDANNHSGCTLLWAIDHLKNSNNTQRKTNRVGVTAKFVVNVDNKRASTWLNGEGDSNAVPFPRPFSHPSLRSKEHPETNLPKSDNQGFQTPLTIQ